MAVCLLSHARSLVCCSLSLSLSYVALSLLLAQKYLVFQNHSSNTDAYTSLTVAMDYLADDSVLAHIYVACRSLLLLLPLSALLLLPPPTASISAPPSTSSYCLYQCSSFCLLLLPLSTLLLLPPTTASISAPPSASSKMCLNRHFSNTYMWHLV